MGRDRNWEVPRVPPAFVDRVGRLAEEWQQREALARLWNRDAALWTGGDEASWLGWLDVPEGTADLEELLQPLMRERVGDVVLLGMGGSSLGSEVLREVVPAASGAPRLHIVDSTDPAVVDRVRSQIEAQNTILIAASKSGTTLETSLLTALFEQWIPAQRCVAITDPGSTLERSARERGYSATVPSPPTVGGRFSVLSPFGLVPALLSGRSVDELLAGAREMAASCRRTELLENPGCVLGFTLAAAHEQGRYQVALRASQSWRPFVDWLEQLLAESLGKQLRGLVPVRCWSKTDEHVMEVVIGPADTTSGTPDQAAEERGDGPPRLELRCNGAERLGAEFFRWQFATAVCGAVLGIHPFDQPDVEAAKVAARAVVARLRPMNQAEESSMQQTTEQRRSDLDRASPTSQGSPDDLAESVGSVAVFDTEQLESVETKQLGAGLRAWASADLAAQLVEPRGMQRGAAIASWLAALANSAPDGGYLAVLDYLPARASDRLDFEEWSCALSARLGLAVAVGRGPRYLHSTGQAYKGGPPSGVFLFLAQRSPIRLAVPRFAADCPGLDLAEVRLAQASGDAQALAERGRNVLVLEWTDPDPSVVDDLLFADADARMSATTAGRGDSRRTIGET